MLKSFRLRIVGALGLSFLPIPWEMFQLIVPSAYAEAPVKQPPRTYSRANIKLPLQMDERQRTALSEIRLFVKAPGADWAPASISPPSQTNFEYHADKDGQYAFMFVLVDKTGKSYPLDLDSRPPHQIVIVDTMPPELSVMPLAIGKTGIFLKCRMNDAHPDALSIRLEYADGEDSWKPMELKQDDEPGVFRIPFAGVLEGKVRASGKDKAGNFAQRIVDLGDPVQSFAVDKTKTTQAATDGSNQPRDLPNVEGPSLTTTQSGGARAAEIPPPNIKGSELSQAPDALKIPDVPPAGADPRRLDERSGPTRISEKANPYFPRQTPLVELAKNDPLAHKAESMSMRTERADGQTTQPMKELHRVINIQRCKLDYSVENAAIGGQPKIEFWGTRDDGKTWMRLLDESRDRSPAILVMPSDGLYGIRIKSNGDGQAPQAGETPDTWIEIDTVAPAIRFMPCTAGTGADAGTLAIQWTVHDKNLISDSINIYYASRPDGAWMSVATGLRGEGSYRWQIPPGIGANVTLRIEATDRAGNVGRNELRDAVPSLQPRIRVLGIGPAR